MNLLTYHESLDTIPSHIEEQAKSSDIEQQPPFGDRKISNIQPQNRGGGSKPTGTYIIITVIMF